MKTLTEKQPWAYLICDGIKNIENRTWKTNFRGKVLIHAGAKKCKFDNWYDSPLNNNQILALPDECSGVKFDYSAIIGSVEFVDCIINHPSIWAEKSEITLGALCMGVKPIWNWVLANPVLFEKPILNVKGKLSFWEYYEDEQMTDQYLPEQDIKD